LWVSVRLNSFICFAVRGTLPANFASHYIRGEANPGNIFGYFKPNLGRYHANIKFDVAQQDRSLYVI
jgi:hypothetical protein